MLESKIALDSIESAIASLSAGKVIIVVDDENRENEGDLVVAAEHMTTEQMAFFIRHTSGIVCVPITAEKARLLELSLMVDENQESMKTAFTNSVDAASGISTGVSATDRLRTVSTIASPNSRPNHLASPGHIFPLICNSGGVQARPGHTEASIALLQIAGCEPVSVIAEVTNDNGSMARLPELAEFAKIHDLALVSIADLLSFLESQHSQAKDLMNQPA